MAIKERKYMKISPCNCMPILHFQLLLWGLKKSSIGYRVLCGDSLLSNGIIPTIITP